MGTVVKGCVCIGGCGGYSCEGVCLGVMGGYEDMLYLSPYPDI